MNHYKYLKLLSSAILVGGISAAAADTAKPFSNFYVGVGTGYSMMNGVSQTVLGGVKSKKSMHSHSIIGKIFGGYEILSVSKIYGALEGYFLLDNQNAKFQQALGGLSLNESLSRKTAWGIRGKLGGALNETVILYGLIGAEASKFSLKGAGGLGKKRSLWAITPGVGASFVLSEKTKLSVEVSRSCYQSLKAMDSRVGTSIKIKPAVNSVAIGISLAI